MMIMPQDNSKPIPTWNDLAKIEADLQKLREVIITGHVDVAQEAADSYKKIIDRTNCRKHSTSKNMPGARH